MSYRMDKKVDGQTHTYTDAGDENSRRPILASGKKLRKKKELGLLQNLDIIQCKVCISTLNFDLWLQKTYWHWDAVYVYT